MNIKKLIITFLFMTLGFNRALALPGEGQEQVDPVVQSDKVFSVDEVMEAAKAQRIMAESVCEGRREGVVDSQLAGLLDVGLYNYCDQYSDEDKFCGCIGETTYEEKLTKKDLQDWQNKLVQESKKNIALNSFKVMKEYKQEKLRALANLPDIKNDSDSYAIKTCDSTNNLIKALAPDCSEAELSEMRDFYSEALKDCDDCEGMEIDSMPVVRRSGGFSTTRGEDFLYFPGHWLGNEFSKQARLDAFKFEEISEKFPSNNTKYTSIGDFQLRELVQDIATRIKERLVARKHGTKPHNASDDFQKRKDSALRSSIESHFLTKRLDGLPQNNIMFRDGSNLEKDIDDYLDYFSKKIPQIILNNQNTDVSFIANYLEKFLSEKQAELMDEKCEEVVSTLKKSCNAISEKDHKLSFEMDKDSVKKIRDKDSKFKTDQLYCVSRDKFSLSFFNSSFTYGSVAFSNKTFDLVTKGENLFDQKISSLNEKYINVPNFTSGIAIEISETLATGARNVYSDLLEPARDGKGILQPGYSILKDTPATKAYYNVASDSDDEYSNSPLIKPRYNIFKESALLFDVGTTNTGESEVTYNPSPENLLFSDDYLERAVRAIKTETPSLKDEAVEFIMKNQEADNQVLKNIDKSELSDIDNVSVKNNVVETSSDSLSIDPSEQSLDLNSNMNSVTTNDEPIDREASSVTGENFGTLPKESTQSYNYSNNMYNSRQAQINQIKSGNFEQNLSTEEQMELKIKELEAKLQTNDLQSSGEISEVESSQVDPSTNSFAVKKETSSAESTELQKLKVELEQMKLDMAKSELAATKKLAKATQVATKDAPVKSVSPVQSTSSANLFSTSKVKRNSEATKSSVSSSPSKGSTSRAQSSSTSPAGQPTSSSSNSNLASSPTSTGTSSVSKGALLTATRVGDSDIINSQGPSTISYQDFSEIKSAKQSELEKLYLEFGPELVIQGGTEIFLEKDVTSGEIKVVEQNKVLKDIKRAPASIIEPEQSKSSRKRFSLEEFNQIIDNSVQKE